MNRNEKHRIAVAGSVLVDRIKTIDDYPLCGQLVQIRSADRAVGGCVPNVALDLKAIRPELDVFAVGTVGNDSDGTFAAETMRQGGVDVSHLTVLPELQTSFTDVMSIPGGQRTFFTYPGASSVFGDVHVPLKEIMPDLLHLGYFLLLDTVDNGDGLKILQKASELGIPTSIDLVTENSDRYSLVLPCLPYTDYLIINEAEAGKLTGITPSRQNLEAIARKLMNLGVRKKVIIHMAECAVCLSSSGFSMLPSYRLPEGYIQGTTGAGDAFCAGALCGILSSWDDLQILAFASSCAVMALGKPDATSGLKTEQEITAFCEPLSRIIL